MSFNNAIKYQLKFKRIIQHGCVGKIALFDKALVVALARVALAMCAMWVGFPSSFFAGGRKKQNKFPSNLHCPVIKLNHFLFQIVAIVSVCSSVFLHLLPTFWRLAQWRISEHKTVNTPQKLMRGRMFN